MVSHPPPQQQMRKPNVSPNGVKGGPEGVCLSKSLKICRNSPTNTSKGYARPAESIPMVSDHFHFRWILHHFEQGSPNLKKYKSSTPRRDMETDRAWDSMGDWQFEVILRPKHKITSNFQSPVVCLCLSPCCSIQEYTPKVLVWGGHFRIFQIRFLKKSAERAGFKLAKNPSKMEVVGDHRNRLRRP